MTHASVDTHWPAPGTALSSRAAVVPAVRQPPTRLGDSVARRTQAADAEAADEEAADARAAAALWMVGGAAVGGAAAGGAVVSHAAAAAVHRLPGAPGFATVCLSREPGTGSRRRLEPGRVHVHTASLAGDVTVVRDLPVTTVARTVCDLARDLEPPDALAVVDACLRAGLVRRDELDLTLARQRGWPGVRAASRVLALADPGATSPVESRVRAALVLGGRIEAPVVGHRTIGASGSWHRIALAWPDRRFVVAVAPEPGSPVPADLAAAGWTVLPVTEADVDRWPDRLAERVLAGFAGGLTGGEPA